MAAAAADPTQQLPSPAETDGEEEVPSEKDKAKKEKAIEKKQKRAASVLSAQEVPVDVLLHFKGKQPPGKCTIAGCLEACHTVLLLRRHLAKKHSGAYVSTAAEEVAWHDNKRATGVPEADTPLWCPLPGCLRSSKLPTAKEGEYKAGDYPLPSFSGAYEHYANIHQASATKEFVCTVEGCTLRFGLEKQLKSHKRSHIEAVSSDTAAACSCGKILASEEALKQHVALVSKRVSAHRQPLALQRLCCSIDAHASAAPHRTAAGARLPHFATFAQTIFDVSGAI